MSVTQKVAEWLKWDKNETSRKQIEHLQQIGDTGQLQRLLLTRLQFGTAGLRGVMGPGYAAMNDLVIIQTSQGVAKYVEATLPEAKQKGVAVSFDGRYNSHRFAQLVAVAFLQLNIPVRLFSKVTPTPFIPFTVLHLGSSAGVMVTASHNPKDDNGYKVYWNNGTQVIAPHDSGIQASIEKNLEPWPKAWDIDQIKTNPLCTDPLEEASKKYFDIIASNIYDRSLNENCGLTFTFTSMHGVGHPYMVKAFEACGFKHYVSVKEQMDPDPEFPTVKFPNPEEGKSSLDLSFLTAEKANSRVILANDPDADRLAVAEKQSSGEWKVFTGNEIGGLLGWWLWRCYRIKNPNTPAENVYMISSTVSSKILSSIAAKEGFKFVETLTGFKWMGNKTCELMKAGKTVLLAFEEAIGYMCGTAVIDKDGVSAAMHVAQMAAYLETQKLTLTEQLNVLFDTYGYHVSNNSYYICHHQPTIQKMFERLRNYSGKDTYPRKIGTYTIKNIRDLTTGYDDTQPNKKAILPTSKSSQMITFYLDNGCVITIRTSGTEPKIKYYSELCLKPGADRKSWKKFDDELSHIISLMVQEFYQPELNGLKPRAE
ncbi:phosphoglucomutase 2 [Rhipicephalus microplus]|uniref:phosphoglucomutase 2 n=1 Tax=Rhipicephalus microplus TaxID=6941 RepID=UPI001889175E|nr:phosphoglucomutase-2-like [Rhipicephalus microplus]